MKIFVVKSTLRTETPYFSFFLADPGFPAAEGTLDGGEDGLSLISVSFPDCRCSSSCIRSLSDWTGAGFLRTPPLEQIKTDKNSRWHVAVLISSI